MGTEAEARGATKAGLAAATAVAVEGQVGGSGRVKVEVALVEADLAMVVEVAVVSAAAALAGAATVAVATAEVASEAVVSVAAVRAQAG